MKEEIGYQRVRALLQEVYGSSFKIASSDVAKLSTGPVIRPKMGKR